MITKGRKDHQGHKWSSSEEMMTKRKNDVMTKGNTDHEAYQWSQRVEMMIKGKMMTKGKNDHHKMM